VYSLRPSFGRLPTLNTRSGMAGQEAVSSVNGPLSRDLFSLSLLCAAVIGEEPWNYDPRVIPLPWREIKLPKKLVFGVIRDDGLVRVNPPVSRALGVTIDALRAQGHEILEMSFYEAAEGVDLIRKCFLADGGISISKLIALSGEDWPEGLKAYASAAHPSTYEMWQIHLERQAWAKGWLDHWMATRTFTTTGSEIDAILMPTCPFAGALQYVGQIHPAHSAFSQNLLLATASNTSGTRVG
jgi:amidase